MPTEPSAPEPNGTTAAELVAWLEEHGLAGAEVVAVIGNEDLDGLDPGDLRLLHGLLEARWQLDHHNHIQETGSHDGRDVAD